MFEVDKYRPETWEDAVLAVIEIQEFADWDKYHVTSKTYRQFYETDAWNMIARKAWGELMAAGVVASFDAAQWFAKFLAGKQHDYGTENITKFGHRGLEVRLWDKVARLENLAKRGKRTTMNEAYEDTLIDMIGYVIIDNLLLMGWFSLPLRGDLTV